MYGYALGLLAITFVLLSTLGKWTVDYFRDPKGLRRYPNMTWFSGITNGPYMLLSYAGFRSKYMLELHRKTGHSIIRTGPSALHFGDMRAIKDIYGHSSKCTKDHQYSVQAGTHMHLADVVDKPEHARKRKVLSSAYALKNLEDWEFKVADKVERLIAQFDKRADGQTVIDYRPWTNYFTIDAIADIGLTHRMNLLDNGSGKTLSARPDGSTYEVDFRECLYANSRATSVFCYSYDWYKRLTKLSKLSPYFNRLWKLNSDWDGIPRYLAAERLKRYQAGEKLDDFFQALMEDRNGSPHTLEWGEVVAEVTIMMNAGSTTTAISMANVMYQMLKHPRCMEKLRQEVDEVLDDDEEVAPYEKVKYLPYLRTCLDESLRLFPPISHGLTREVPPEGQEIAGQYIVGGTTVNVSSFIAHRDPSIFPDPETYSPERWLGEAGKDLGPYFIAFSAGARGCIGRNIAYLEQTVLLASMLHRYNIELADPNFEVGRYEWQNLHLTELPIRITRRKKANVEPAS
ncbi:Benzoate 4-monooxygenase [Pseudocercospora fuligena]|uniref:Benzoate 4-monooxygenase n=1 Tax=Pseudocercospora fuligena TaxID=685502 RepID=A0A8H6RM66_9PEZI|nr:Benzoate 4-monooxygenase [Pseudocercospora fuligena]